MRPGLPAPSLLWFGSLRDASGHADEGRGFLRALEAHGAAPAARNLNWGTKEIELHERDQRILDRQLARTPAAPLVAVHQYLPSRRQITVDGVNVARAMFETDRMPESWLQPLLDRDEVWVPSAFNVDTFERSGIPRSKLRTVGGTLDFDLFAPGAEPLDLGVGDGRFVFLTNFDFSERKGWRELLRAWGRAFGADDGVALVLKTGSFYVDEAEVRSRISSFLRAEYGGRANGGLAPIELLTRTLPSAEMPRLYAAADAYVLPSRGEGWGRPYMEALAMGLPTIASRCSAHLEFMDEDASWLVDGQLVPVPDDAELFNGLYRGHRWFQADVDDLAAAMRSIAADPAAARARAALARPRLVERFGPHAVAGRMVDLARDVAERHGARSRASVTIRGEFGARHSLAVCNDGLADALEDSGHAVRRRDVDAAPIKDDEPAVSHSWPPDFTAASPGPAIVVLPWEFGAPPRAWVESARRQADRVWVPSEYVRRGYVAGGMPPGVVEVVPNGVDLERFRPDGPRHDLGRTASCVFLFVGGTTWRKGIDVLLAAWPSAFGPEDDVLLAVKDFGAASHYRGQTNGPQVLALAGRDDVAPVVYLAEDLGRDALPALYRAADVLVAPYRAEGFCLPALEAMACGLPVVHTGTGPTAEFVPPAAGWALPARQVPMPPEGALPPLAGEAYVQEVAPDDLAAALRAAADDAPGRRRRGQAGREAALGHGWSRAAAAARETLRTLTAEQLPLAREIAPAELDRRDHLVLFAPDWRAEERWTAALDAWARAVAPGDPVTLALHVGEGDAETLAARILARLEAAGHEPDALPDLALCPPGGAPLASLVLAADAVLVADPACAPPELVRRAARILAPDVGGLARYVRSLDGGVVLAA